MSSICGILNLDGRPVERAMLERMSAAAMTPGPDASGYWLTGPVGLAHVAFHVTPESIHETQPLIWGDDQIVVAADVRLDNRDELMRRLREELTTRQPTDAELVLAAYRKWHHQCVAHLLGDFAFAVWDAQARQLFLARDSLGARGLCYYRGPQSFAFATDFASILDLPCVAPRLNETKIA
ncbi:MAG: asparagine synthetase B, partial [Gammaproteobacteria bacterium]|nr:asparagine synthetase B [Gammaproteobacteria bacterium]